MPVITVIDGKIGFNFQVASPDEARMILAHIESVLAERTQSWGEGWEKSAPDFMYKLETARNHVDSLNS